MNTPTNPIKQLNTIGLLGGMSWESSALYYRDINSHVRTALGGFYSAPLILDSVNFAQFERWMSQNDWTALSACLQEHAMKLEAAGATCIAIATNTMHKVYDDIAAAVNLPVLHIATPTIAALKVAGIDRVAFLGTRYSMEQDFMAQVYAASGIELLIPEQNERDDVHDIIFNELCQGIVNADSRERYQHIIANLEARGVILGCTEIALLIEPKDVKLPIFDTAALHTQALATYVIKG